MHTTTLGLVPVSHWNWFSLLVLSSLHFWFENAKNIHVWRATMPQESGFVLSFSAFPTPINCDQKVTIINVGRIWLFKLTYTNETWKGVNTVSQGKVYAHKETRDTGYSLKVRVQNSKLILVTFFINALGSTEDTIFFNYRPTVRTSQLKTQQISLLQPLTKFYLPIDNIHSKKPHNVLCCSIEREDMGIAHYVCVRNRSLIRLTV